MSAESVTREDALAREPPTPPFEVGDFAYVDGKKHDLVWCPLCETDPDRPSHRFRRGEPRNQHFFEAHDADDVGRPLADLVAELPNRVDRPRQGTNEALARYERAKTAKRDRGQAGLDAFGGEE